MCTSEKNSIRKCEEKDLRETGCPVIKCVSVINASQLAFHRVMYSGIRVLFSGYQALLGITRLFDSCHRGI